MQIATSMTPPRMEGRKVAVTGGRGFIGRALVAALLRDEASVTAILRDGHDAGRMRTMGVRVEIAALTDSGRMRACLDGCDTLFHFAYDVRATGADNLTAFRSLMDAARDAGVARVVHASSAVVYDTWPNGKVGADAPITTGGSDYRCTKIAMEQSLIDGPLPAAIVQPTIVYGQGSALWTLAPMNALRRGGVVLPEPVGLCPAVFVSDVVEAAIRASLVTGLGRERFIVSGPDNITWQDFYSGYAGLLGAGTVVLCPHSDLAARFGPERPMAAAGPSQSARLSATMRRVIGSRRFDALMHGIRPIRAGGGPVYPDRAMLSLYSARPVLDLSHTKARLGSLPGTTFEQGLAAIRDQLR
jgi:nucleoside-diphosphate-sugar epimerase